MKKTFLSLAASALFVAAAMGSGLALAHDSTQSLTPSTAAISTSQTSSFAGTQGGASLSHASNFQTATTGGAMAGAAGSTLFGTTKYATVGIEGSAATAGQSVAGNLSIGNASGTAAASGVSTASIVGVGEAHTVSGGPLANVTGNAESITGTAATSGSNGLGVSSGAAVGSFQASASATQIKVGPFQSTDVQSAATSAGLTLPGVQITLGTGTVQLQNEAAANAFGQARVGSVVSN